MIALYHSRTSTNSRKVRIVLEEKKIPYEPHLIDLQRRGQRDAGFLAMNPYGKVPVISDGDLVIYDSTIINEYLEEKYPDPALMPADPVERARVRMMEDYRDEHFTKLMSVIRSEHRNKRPGERDEDAIRRARERAEAEFPRLEGELSGKEFLAGSFSLADIAFVPDILLFAPFGIRVPSDLKNVLGWIERLKVRPGIRKIMEEDGPISG